MLEFNYKPCFICGKYTDDGGLYENKLACHDCLDKLHEEKVDK